MARHLALLISVIAVVGIALAGCGGGASGATDGLSAQQILTQASAKTDQQSSYQVALTATLSADVEPGALGGQVGTLLTQPISISGEGTVQKPGQITVDLSTKLATTPLQVNITKIGDHLYLSVLGQAIELTLPKGAVGSVDPSALPSSLAGWIANPKIVGNEDVDGVPTVHIQGQVDPEAVANDISTLANSVGASGATASSTAAQVQTALQRGVVDVWVGTDDLLIYGANVDVALKGKVDAVPGVNALALTLTMRLSAFGTQVNITAPAGARKINLGQVSSLLGS